MIKLVRLLWSPCSLASVAARCTMRLGITVGVIAVTLEFWLVYSGIIAGWDDGYATMLGYINSVYIVAGFMTVIYMPILLLAIIGSGLLVNYYGKSRTRIGGIFRVIFLGLICLFLPILAWSIAAVLEQASNPSTEVKTAANYTWLSSPTIKILASHWCLCVLLTLQVIVWAIASFKIEKELKDANGPHCKNCNYLLIGIDSLLCPECGLEREAKNEEVDSTLPLA